MFIACRIFAFFPKQPDSIRMKSAINTKRNLQIADNLMLEQEQEVIFRFLWNASSWQWFCWDCTKLYHASWFTTLAFRSFQFFSLDKQGMSKHSICAFSFHDDVWNETWTVKSILKQHSAILLNIEFCSSSSVMNSSNKKKTT